ncbi:glutathione peroxidase [Photobacterium galatheae]|uniref:Glutathione peroxidase n=1 Tax=Photobacterium galatheae TaxID=1654360 RepID=A0A066RIW3_9GAMM|nr:glutathione peroxidase [Photobacterium galatheae]KDM90249.1 glutathione peroxidase [Photobacterium galatheae]MCM0151489.1 glutathione peroxidase [Photobacterium galatheae]
MTTFYDFSANTLKGETQPMHAFEGKVVLVVNTASQCGFTPQYQGLQALHEKYSAQGLVILGFPCNQFGQQEPGSGDEISEFCELNYGVGFPMFEKIDVNGPQRHPMFAYLTETLPGLFGKKIKWNFTKFLISRDGKPIKRYAPITKPEALEADIQAALDK